MLIKSFTNYIRKSSKGNEILRALADKQFELYYQPKIDLVSGHIIGFEALLRWHHPTRGLLSPDEFLINWFELEVGYWVIDNVLTQLEAWTRWGFIYPVSINISALHLIDKNFSKELSKILSRHKDVAPSLLEFEILESDAIEDLQKTQEILNSCRELGIRFSLDDFGTGYSCFKYLKHIPMDYVKIDKEFVRDIINNSQDRLLIASILKLGPVYGFQIIAEGIETQEHALILREMGCEYGQGFGIAKPMPGINTMRWAYRYQQSQDTDLSHLENSGNSLPI